MLWPSARRLPQPLPMPPAARDDRAVVHVDPRIAAVQRLDRRNAVDIDQMAAVHAHEARGIEPVLQIGQRAAQRVDLAAHVQVGVVARGLDPFDVRSCLENPAP